MIITEIVTIGDKSYKKTYSDAERYVVRDGISYSEAIDPIDTDREYTEGDVIEKRGDPETPDDDTATEADYKAALGEFGVEI